MALTKYYGLKSSNGEIMQKGWTSSPSYYAYALCPNSSYNVYQFSAYCYCESKSTSGNELRTLEIAGSGNGCYNYIESKSYKKSQLYSSTFSKKVDWFNLKTEFEKVSTTRQLNVGEELRLYASSGTSSSYTSYTFIEYYKINIVLSLSGNSTGTIALYNGNTLLKSGAGTYTYVGTSIPTLTIKYTPASHDSTWHNAYYFDGMRLDGSVQDATFDYGSASFNFKPTSNSHTCSINIGSRKTITFVGRTGISSYSASFNRTYDTGNFTRTSSGTELAPTSVSGSTNTKYLRFESGNVNVSSTASAGYIFTASGGFCSDVAALNLHGNGSSSISGLFVTPTQGGTVNIVPTSYNIKISMPSTQSSWGSVKITDSAGNSGTSLVIVSGRVYTFAFTSSRSNYEQPSVSYWKKDGVSLGSGVVSWTAPSTLTGDVNIEPQLAQNAWPVSITTSANGSAKWIHRYNISPLTEISNTGYLRANKSDYGVVSITPNDQYAVSSRTLVGVEEYSSGGAQAFRLLRDASHTSHNIAYTFALAECVVSVQLPTEFADKVEVGIGTSSSTSSRLYFYGYESATEWAASTSYSVGTWVNVTIGEDVTAYRCAVAHTSGTFADDLANGKWTPMYVTVMCRVKSDYYDQYRVADWNIGGIGGLDGETMVAGRSYYYIVTPSNVSGKTTLVCRPRVISTVNKLTITKKNIDSSAIDYNQFAVVNVKKGASGTYQTISTATWSDNVIENTEITITANPLFGGKIGTISYSGFTPLEEDGNMIRFNMPGADTNISVQIGEQGKVTLVLNLSNLTATTPIIGSIKLTSPASSSVSYDVTPSSTRPVSINVYRETNYTLTASDTDEVYGFADWYKNGSVSPTPAGGSDLVRNINLTNSTTTYVAAYAIRQTYDITQNYGIRSGSDVTPISLPSAGVFGCVITTPRDGEGGWVMNRSVAFKVGNWPSDSGVGTTTEDGEIYKWTPECVQVKYGENAYETVWTYDSIRPSALTGSFRIRGDMVIRMIYVKEHLVGYAMTKARLMGGVIPTMGQLGIYSTGMTGYSSVASTASAACMTLKRVVFTASPNPGYSFGGWYSLNNGVYSQVVTTTGVNVNGTLLEVESLTSSGATYYASFVASESHLKVWNDSEDAKTLDWRSKVYVGSQFFAMRCVRVYSDVYPVTLTLLTATSPNDCFNTDASRKIVMNVTSQRPILIPTMRLEKYFAFNITGKGRINHVGIGSSMEALK